MSVCSSRALSLLITLGAVTVSACSSDDSSHGSTPVSQQNNNAFVPPGTGSDQDGGGRGLQSGGSTGGNARDAGLVVVGMDSGTPAPAPASDSGVDAATIAAFACSQNSDCQLKDIGSCCGFRQGCANTGAVFGPPLCTVGEVGDCSFPIIDHCECQQNVCTNVLSAVQGSMQF